MCKGEWVSMKVNDCESAGVVGEYEGDCMCECEGEGM